MDANESLLRPDLDFLDLVFQEKAPDATRNSWCRRVMFTIAPGHQRHQGQHYSFGDDYEIIWPQVAR